MQKLEGVFASSVLPLSVMAASVCVCVCVCVLLYPPAVSLLVFLAMSQPLCRCMYVGAHVHSVVTSCHESCCYADVCGCSRPQCGHLMPRGHAAMQMYVYGGAHVHSLVTSCHESCCYADVCGCSTSIVWSPHATSHAAMQMYSTD